MFGNRKEQFSGGNAASIISLDLNYCDGVQVSGWLSGIGK
jgi:hypothetical protein